MQHFTPQQFLQGLRARVRLKAPTQVQELHSLAAVQRFDDLVDRLELVHVRVVDRPGRLAAQESRKTTPRTTGLDENPTLCVGKARKNSEVLVLSYSFDNDAQ